MAVTVRARETVTVREAVMHTTVSGISGMIMSESSDFREGFPELLVICFCHILEIAGIVKILVAMGGWWGR